MFDSIIHYWIKYRCLASLIEIAIGIVGAIVFGTWLLVIKKRERDDEKRSNR